MLHNVEEIGVDPDADLSPVNIDRRSTADRYCHSSLDEPERNRVDRDIVTTPFFGESLGQTGDARLRGRVIGLTSIAAEAGDGRDVHDLTAWNGFA